MGCMRCIAQYKIGSSVIVGMRRGVDGVHACSAGKLQLMFYLCRAVLGSSFPRYVTHRGNTTSQANLETVPPACGAVEHEICSHKI